MEKIKQILETEIRNAEAILYNISKHQNMYQPNAELFYKGRKQQAEELLERITHSDLINDDVQSLFGKLIENLKARKDEVDNRGFKVIEKKETEIEIGIISKEFVRMDALMEEWKKITH